MRRRRGEWLLDQCYSACLVGSEATDRQTLLELTDQLWETRRDASVSQSEWNTFLLGWKQQSCAIIQSRFLGSLCLRLGVPRTLRMRMAPIQSYVRNVFYRAYNKEKADVSKPSACG